MSIPGSRTSKKWSGDEDEKLKAAVDGNGGKNWKKIAEVLPGYESTTWFGLFGPQGLKPELVSRINTAANSVVAASQG